MKKNQLFPIMGFLMGWGAPSGAVFLRFCRASSNQIFLAFTLKEWTSLSFFYWYMIIGTCLAGTLMGYILACMTDNSDFIPHSP